jgi:hypothetical protein
VIMSIGGVVSGQSRKLHSDIIAEDMSESTSESSSMWG